MVSTLLHEAESSLSFFFKQVNQSSLTAIVESCFNTQGILFFSGVGKSGMIAEKIAATLTSTGTRAVYLNPTNLLHGDLGVLSSNDAILFFSKSGEAEELLNLLPFVRKKGIKTIAIVSKEPSRLSQRCDISMLLPLQKELCSFDLVPTISTQIQLIFGDVLAIALMQKRNFSKEEYSFNHPSGSIGKKITIQVKDLMLTDEHIPLCLPSHSLAEVLVELSQKRCGAILVADENQILKGIFTDGDLRRALQSYGPQVLHHKMETLMTRSAVIVEPGHLAWDALKTMQQNPTKWIMVTPVMEDEKVVGILRMHDIIQSGIS